MSAGDTQSRPNVNLMSEMAHEVMFGIFCIFCGKTNWQELFLMKCRRHSCTIILYAMKCRIKIRVIYVEQYVLIVVQRIFVINLHYLSAVVYKVEFVAIYGLMAYVIICINIL